MPGSRSQGRGTEPIRALERSLESRFTWLERHLAGMRVHREKSLVLADCGMALAGRNVVLQSQFEADQAVRWIEFVRGWFAQGSGTFTWWLGPGDSPENLGMHLSDAGFLPLTPRLVMAAPLRQPGPTEPAPLWLEIRPVDSVPSLEAFTAVRSATEKVPEWLTHRFFDAATGGLLSADSPIQYLVGYLDGVPVACSELVFDGEYVGLYGIAVLEGHRGMGLGTTMVRESLLTAARRGCTMAVTVTDSPYRNLMSHLGFTVHGTQTGYLFS